ncbi:hypothetical protein E0Z10_g7081 [Xylaria hypoxylon]|uniref:Carrier domain-containing protein n=1 Tax=Xylaria hypoxylon TaxID=37992 RepID=A0A4Z0YW47_9PEZI|nr:hypothetical protein E0Z10_g7081 [Xylaria hypoxylon]
MERFGEPVAIIGIGCRFPGDSMTPSKFWRLLREPYDLLKPLDERLDPQSWYHKSAKHHGHFNVKHAYHLHDGDSNSQRHFDAPFFGISAVEANTMDPQMRMLLETVYEALEASGQSIEGLRGSDTAVYSGMMINDYRAVMERDMLSMGTYHASGSSRAMMSNRLSYAFDWHGPSMTIDTACSSSMVAVHQAVMQLRSGQSRVAIAAGANLLLDPTDYIALSNLEMISPDGRSRMWDKGANGYARGEGVAAVVLKLLSAAEADGDHIECIVRETATNHDGRTKGITMPSATAQTQLISDCYARAGLDLSDPTQRPQYFEAHGTGTPAGDPIEAEAIHTAFSANTSANTHNGSKIYVGSVKTVIGHSEGAAGLAALIKTCLALQNSTIPPNLLFQELNPNIRPFYANLAIPKFPIPWPAVPHGSPRRASVNSFGFGGSNSHAILENYTPKKKARPSNDQNCVIPFVFSAASSASLSSNLVATYKYLRSGGADINLRDLAVTLYNRRSRHSYGTIIVARNMQELCRELEKRCQDSKASIGIRPSTQLSSGQYRKPKILAVFTGQGAQCPRMGAELIEQSEYCRQIIGRLEARLASLPEIDRPSWSLKQELLEAPTTRIGKASLSQPLCTALQILQVDLLRCAEVEFSAVVGHSSGEIGAAYCAGVITAEEAICIAYYRGLVSERTANSGRQYGAMIAVETTLSDAQELCDEEEFENQVCVAAINSPTSITLSGDADAVERIRMIFEDEGKFSRILHVDQAYHSSHMMRCSKEYLCALQGLNIESKQAKTPWFSSVDAGREISIGDLPRIRAPYWNENMVQPVMFMQAIDEAWKSQGPFDMVVELGPHPVLKRPVLETIQELHDRKIPYTGVHTREEDAVESFSRALGSIWTHAASANLINYDKHVTGYGDSELVTGLPPYAWDHGKRYWHESRYAKSLRTRSDAAHELLGHLTPDSSDQDMRWRNVLCPNEIPWLKNHSIENQVIFPAAGYVVEAVEATAAMAAKRSKLTVSLIEVHNLEIHKALIFDSDDTKMEIIVTLSEIRQHDNVIDASFKFHAAPMFLEGSLGMLASSSITVMLGDSDRNVLPSRGCLETGLSKIDHNDFYHSLSKLGYEYAEQFRALRNLQRKFGSASGSIVALESSAMLLHPAVLDAAFQSLFLANCTPNSGGIWSLHVPRTINVVRVNPSLCAVTTTSNSNLVSFDCVLPKDTSAFEGDIDLFTKVDDVEQGMIQIQGLCCVPLTRTTAQNDREMFATTVWDVAAPDGDRASFEGELTEEQTQLATLLVRMSVFFLRELASSVPENHTARQTDPYKHYFRFASHILSQAQVGKLPLCSSEWADDSYEDLREAYEPFLKFPDVHLLRAFGDNIVEIATGRTQAIEIGMKDGMLSEVYETGLGFQEYTTFLARIVKQIVHRYPSMKILEVGAGTGAATKKVFSHIGKRFSSYTFTDISSGFFERAQDLFGNHCDTMIYKVLDISRDISSQGFNEQSYDLVIASAVLHATPNLEDTLRNVRRLLKPGGFLVVFELRTISTAMGTMFGALPGWWLGAQDGRALSPCISLAAWDAMLRAHGFSGCDTSIEKFDSAVMPMTIFVSQAVNSQVSFLRAPQSTPTPLFQDDPMMAKDELIILGGGDPRTSGVVVSLVSLLGVQWGDRIRTVPSLEVLDLTTVSSKTTLLSLLDLEAWTLDGLMSDTWDALRICLQQINSLLWVSSNRRSENPHANMMIGLLRSVKHEIPTLEIQSLDIDGLESPSAQNIADSLLAFKAAVIWQRQDSLNNGLLWTVEPELGLENGTLLIPRIIPNQEMNDRYNASRRLVLAPGLCHRASNNLGLVGPEGELCWQKAAVSSERRRNSTIRITHSLRSALRIPTAGFMNLVLGCSRDSNNQILALTTQHTLEVIPFIKLTLSTPLIAGQEAAFISLLAYHLLAKLLVSHAPHGSTVVVNEPGELFAAILKDEAQRNSVKVVFITLSTAKPGPDWHTLHPMAPDRQVRDLIEKDATIFFDFSVDQPASSAGARLKAYLPSHCTIYDYSSVFADSSVTSEPLSMQSYLQNLLADSVSRCLEGFGKYCRLTPSIIPLGAHLKTRGGSALDIVDWSIPASGVLTARVLPADSQIRFSGDKTYWLNGLSGSLGLLLCEWMVHRGARYVVISSRSPKVKEQWLAKMRGFGADVRVFVCDITDRAAVLDLYRLIEFSLPQVAGVCQGAMVLEDVTISNMSLDSLLKVTKPKVLGSIHMDELFQDRDHDLEFFIFFSSAGSIIGNVGQGNYAAGNMFMTALAERRRRRGQIASVMHIGPIYGVGYLNNHNLDFSFYENSTKKPMVPISERDFCQHFAEAVIAGQLGSQPDCLEITSGLAKVESPHESGPVLSHMVLDQVENIVDTRSRLKVSLKTQLVEVRGLEQLAAIIREALLSKLSDLFQMELSTLSHAQSSTMRLDEMGTDSLIAIEIRTWFVKELQVNIPVLKILGGMTVDDLSNMAVKTIPRSLVPKLVEEEQSNESLSLQKMEEPINMDVLEEVSMVTAQSPDPSLPSTTWEDLGRAQITTSSVGSQIATSSGDNSPSPTSTEPTPFSEFLSQNPIEISKDDDALLSDEKKQLYLLQATELSVEISRISNEASAGGIADQPKALPKQVTQPFVGVDQKVLELSFSQSLFYFSAGCADNPTHRNMTSSFRMTGGELRIEDMKTAVLALGREHESLRTRFFAENSRPMQGVMKSSLLHLEHYTIQSESELETYFNDMHNHVYDLERGDTVRLAAISLSGGDGNFFIIGNHHLAMDGQSAVPFMKSVLQHYYNTQTNREQTAPPKQYSDSSERQHADFRLGKLENELAYWKTELANPPPPLPIMRMSPFISRPLLQGYGNRHVNVRIGLETKRTIRALCRRCRVTPFNFYLAVYRVLLCRYTGTEDFAIGIGDANRIEEDTMESIGDFVNVLPLIFHTESRLQFDTMLQETRSKTHAALEHSRLPFHLLLSELGVARSATTTPIFQAFMDYRLVGETMGWGEFQLELLSFRPSIMAYDVTVDIFDNAGGDCRLSFIAPQSTICEPEIFDDDKIQSALDLGRGPIYESRQWGHTVVHRIDEMIRRYPNKTAIIDGDGNAISYHDFRDGIDKIAAELEDVGVTSGSRVAVLQESTPNWVSTILAIWRVGGTYVPLDLGSSWPRLAAMIKDAQPQAVLVDENTQKHVRRLELQDQRVINVSTAERCGRQIPISALPDSASAILYTSGSSGTPKGIVLKHRGIQSWLQPCGLLYNMKPGTGVVLQQSSQGFDMSLMQVLTALCFGGSVCLLPRKFRGDARAISETITRYDITHTYGTPSEYLSWLRYGNSQALRRSSWKTALVGGEPLAASVLKEFAALDKDDLRFHHMYGTTESTFCATVMELDCSETDEDTIRTVAAQVTYPAGVVLPNYNVYVLDEYQRPLLAGFKGEIFIGGGGVAQGYLNNPSLTAETFIRDPFATLEDHARGLNMMQRTGDLGRWSRSEHGAIIIEGRTHGDTMVKLRGLRVDLREIETAMLSAGTGLLSDVVVSVRQTSPDLPEFLVAHIVFKNGPSQDNIEHNSRVQQIRANIRLPLSMKPSFIMELDDLPMTTSGKLNRRAIDALPLPLEDHTDHVEIVWTAFEQRLKTIWEDVLLHGINNTLSIKPETDFFHVGGTSLLLLALRDKIKAEFNVELSLLDLFEVSTLSSMAGRIDGETYSPEVTDWDEETRLSSSVSDWDDNSPLQSISKSSARVVVMTGGTGYLGKALLQALEDDPTVKEIHRLAVRNAASRTDLEPFTKVTAHEGDLSQARLGLSQAMIDDLFSSVDLVIHNGADTSYMKTYRSMQQSNYQTTRDLIEWCMPRMVPFHYISTAGVGSYASGVPLREASVRSTAPPLVGDLTGYTACKWASEVFLENLVKRHPNWPVCVHRPTLISRDDIPQLDAIHNILGFARKLGAVASSSGIARGVVNVVELDAVVAGIMKCVLSAYGHGHGHGDAGCVHFVNHAGTLELPLDNMRKWALERTASGDVRFADGVEFAEIPVAEWIRRAIALGMHPTMGLLLTTFARHGEVEFPVVLTGNDAE